MEQLGGFSYILMNKCDVIYVRPIIRIKFLTNFCPNITNYIYNNMKTVTYIQRYQITVTSFNEDPKVKNVFGLSSVPYAIDKRVLTPFSTGYTKTVRYSNQLVHHNKERNSLKNWFGFFFLFFFLNGHYDDKFFKEKHQHL